MNFRIIILALMIALAGCVEQEVAESDIVSVEASPEKVFAGGETILYIDVENKDTKPMGNINIDVFDKGAFSEIECDQESMHLDELDPDGLYTTQCKLKAPDSVPQQLVNTKVQTRVNYDAKLSIKQLLRLISPENYELMMNTGELEQGPSTYVYRDKNIELQADFSKNMPIIDRGIKEYVYFTIRNIGGGYLDKLEKGDVTISGDKVRCDEIGELSPINNQFPRITCELNLDGDTNYLSSHLIDININYNYEVRKTLYVGIER